MTDAPERIWAGEGNQYPDGLYGSWSVSKIGERDSEYLRSDLVPSWQPIETAPKTSTEVLLGWAGRDIPMIAYWNRIHGNWFDNQEPLTGKPPTHWMPLPEPPK